MTNLKTTEDLADVFVERLERLDRASLARLKRNAGNSLAESRGVMGMFYGLLPTGVNRYDVPRYFMVSTLFPLAEGGGQANLGASLRRIRKDGNQAGLDRRMERLLDADEEQLAFHLRQALHYIASQRGRVNWSQLLHDLCAWTHPDKYIQRQWAERYYVGGPSEDAETVTESTTN